MLVLLWEKCTECMAWFESKSSPGIVVLNVVMVRLYVAANMVIKPNNIGSVRIAGEEAN